MSFSSRHFPRLLSIAITVALVVAVAVSVAPTHAVRRPVAGQRLRHASLTSSSSVPAYYTVASDGGIFAFGGLPFWGSMGGHYLAKPMVGIAPTATAGGATGGGYWTVASDGGVFSFGAPFHGSLGNIHLNKPVIAMASTPDGGGYWLFASDGGVFAFGNAGFYGSAGSDALAKPVVGASATPDGRGYWLVASDGGIFAYGDAPFDGSLGGHALEHPVVSMTAADMGGYWLTDSNGAVTAFGDAGYFGSAPQHLAAPMVSMADGPGTGLAGNEAYPSGSYGYDISKFQDNPPTCNEALPSGHIVGIVQATGAANGAPNPCLAHEAAWAGAGLNLYIYMTDGTSATNEPGCNGDTACNFGYQAGLYAYNYAQLVGVNPLVSWWLDVENPSGWSSNLAENAQEVQGAINGLRGFGINNVGIYASPDIWNEIVGDYQPAVPLWVAWWTGNGPANCQNVRTDFGNEQLPTGPVFVTQYADMVNGQSLDADYAC